jgi:hypothetical protein
MLLLPIVVIIAIFTVVVAAAIKDEKGIRK